MNSYFQTEAWGEFKAAFGWRAERASEWLGMTRGLPGGRALRYFPEIAWSASSQLSKKLATLQQTAATNTIFTRLEFLEEWDNEKAAALKSLGLVKSFESIQPEYRQWVPIAADDEAQLAAMKSKGRYNVGVALRKDLTLVTGGAELVPDFFALYSFTAGRTKFSGRGQKYFEALAQLLEKENVGELLVIKKDNEPLAAAILLYYDDVCSYLYGGSGGDRSLMAPYLVHYFAMKRARERGCTLYDLLAISPFTQNAEGDPEFKADHPYAGLTRFKTQFGGRSIRLLGSWDLVHKPVWYTMYKLATTARRGSAIQ